MSMRLFRAIRFYFTSHGSIIKSFTKKINTLEKYAEYQKEKLAKFKNKVSKIEESIKISDAEREVAVNSAKNLAKLFNLE